MARSLTTEECYTVFEKYDKDLFNYYMNNAGYFGCDARRYAEYLLEQKKGKGYLKNLGNGVLIYG